MKIFIVLLAAMLAGCACPNPAEPWPPAATPTGNRWEQVPDTGGTFRMQVKEGYVYLYWDPPKPNTMVFVPAKEEGR